MTRHQILHLLANEAEKDPYFFGEAIQAMTSGLVKSAKDSSYRESEWEAIALMAATQRFNGNTKEALAQKIDAMQKTATFNWSPVTERMKK